MLPYRIMYGRIIGGGNLWETFYILELSILLHMDILRAVAMGVAL